MSQTSHDQKFIFTPKKSQKEIAVFVRNILVVEDENIIALDLKNRLKKMGYKIPAIASTGEDAIRLADELEPDLVIMDILLKGKLDGVEAARVIRSKNHIPVIFLSSYSDEKTCREANEASPFGYLIKPLNEWELKAKIDSLSVHRATVLQPG